MSNAPDSLRGSALLACTLWVSMPSIIHYQTIHVKIPLVFVKIQASEGVSERVSALESYPKASSLYDGHLT